MKELEIIGRNIVRLRKERGMTQEDLCGLAQIDRSHLSEIENGKMNWEDVYKDFASADVFKGYSADNISEIPASTFSRMGIREIFELFELSSQVETKIKIFPWEKEVLILAGRYSVFLKENIIKGLLN